MKKLFVLTTILFLFYGCGGGSDDDDDSGSNGNSSSGGTSASASACNVNDIISSGMSCTYDNGSNTFSVTADGRGCINGNICSSGASNSVGSFSASNQNDGTWKITSVP